MRKWLVTALLAGCISSGLLADEIKIGVVAPISDKTEFAKYGQSMVNGMKIAEEEINKKGGIGGNAIKLVIEDNEGRADKTGEVVNKLIKEDKVLALIGPIIDSNCIVAAKIAQNNKVPMIAPVATDKEITNVGNYVYRIAFSDNYQGYVLADFLSYKLSAKKVAILKSLEKDDVMEGVKIKILRNSGIITDELIFKQSENDFIKQLAKIAESKVDAMYISADDETAALIIKQARLMKITAAAIGTEDWNSERFLNKLGDSQERIFVATQFSSETKNKLIGNFLKAYYEKYKINGSVFSAFGYDAVMLVADSLTRTGIMVDRDKFRDAINETTSLKGLTGILSFDENREPLKNISVLTVDKGKFVYKETVNPWEMIEKKVEKTPEKIDKVTEEKTETEKQSKVDNNTMIIIVVIFGLASVIALAVVNQKK